MALPSWLSVRERKSGLWTSGASAPWAGGQAQPLIHDGHEGVGRDDVNLVGFNLGAVLPPDSPAFGSLWR